jgi:carbon monoxide dehydrogenase subunit G
LQLKQRFVVAHPRELVWAFFGRMEEVTPCMPGAALAEPPAGTQAKFTLNVKLGPISAAFVGDAELERDAEAYCGVIRGTARDTRGDSRVRGVVSYVLTPEANGSATAVDIDVDFALTGRLAQFSRGGIVQDLASRLTADFARNLETALKVKNSPQAAEVTPAGAAGAAPPGMQPRPGSPSVGASATKPLNAGALLVAVIWTRIRAMLRAIFKRR